ncbi:leucine rich repeat-containing protein, partial [Cardiosporidium cionae]
FALFLSPTMSKHSRLIDSEDETNPKRPCNDVVSSLFPAHWPIVVFSHICENFTASDVVSFSYTCRHWHAMLPTALRNVKFLDLKSSYFLRCMFCWMYGFYDEDSSNAPLVSTIELDCFLLTPNCFPLPLCSFLSSLTLIGMDGQTDAFLQGLLPLISQLSSLSISNFGVFNFSDAMLKRLANSFINLKEFSFERQFDQNFSLFLHSMIATTGHSLQHLSLNDIDQTNFLNICQTLGPHLLSFSYTNTNQNWMAIDDNVLNLISTYCEKLKSLKLISNVSIYSSFDEPIIFPGDYLSLAISSSSRIFPRYFRQEEGNPLVSLSGLTSLGKLLGNLEVLHISRGYGLKFCEATDVDLMQIFSTFSKHLSELQLNGFFGLSDGFIHQVLLYSATSTVSSLEKVFNSAEGSSSSMLISKAFSPPYPHLLKLSLEGSAVSDVGLQTLAATVGNQLSYLSLKRCRYLTETGYVSIADFCFNVRHLNLGSCSNINDLSMQRILQKCKLIETLVLNDTLISDISLHSIGAERGSTMKELALHRCEYITDNGLFHLAEKCPNIILLSLSSCTHITSLGIGQIASHCLHLMKFRLDETDINNDALQTISNHLFHLRYLHLHGCTHINAEGFKYFSAQTQPFLKCIEISPHQISKKFLQIL